MLCLLFSGAIELAGSSRVAYIGRILLNAISLAIVAAMLSLSMLIKFANQFHYLPEVLIQSFKNGDAH